MASHPDDAQVIFEKVIVDRATRGDEKAFVTLGSLHAQKLYSIARNLSSTEAEAVEVMEQALQQAFEQIGRLPAELSFRTFVCRFAVRNATARLRRAARPVAGSLRRFLPRFDGGELLPGPQAPDFAAVARREDFAGRIRDALESLDPEDRAAFVLRVIEDLPVEEAAAIQETTVPLLRARAHQASLLLAGYVQHLLAESTTAESPWLATWIH